MKTTVLGFTKESSDGVSDISGRAIGMLAVVP